MKYIASISTQWASIFSLLFASAAIQAETVHISHCMGACPVSNANSLNDASIEIVVRHLFAAAVNKNNGQAQWLAYKVMPDSVGVASLLPRRWLLDRLMTASSQLEAEAEGGLRVIEPEFLNEEENSYLTSEIQFDSDDRGRLVPMSSFAGTPYWDELNYLSNMAPLPEFLRLGSWSRLDMAVNEYSQRGVEVFVVSGPIMAADAGSGLSLPPQAYFKLISNMDSYSAFIFREDTAQHAEYCEQRVTIEELERRTGLQFFPDMQVPSPQGLGEEIVCDSF